MKKAFLALLFCTFHIWAFPQWFQHNNIPVSSNLHEVSFTDPDHGWIVGEDGTILHSSDGGSSWLVQVSNTALNLTSVSMADQLHAWATASGSDPYGLILRTTDGGNNWVVTDTSDYMLSDVCFPDTLHGWAIGSNNNTGGPGVVKITSDGGNTWTDVDLLDFMFPVEVVFVNPQTGYIGGTNRINDHFRMKVMKTTDGGFTWNVFLDWAVDGDMFFSDMMFLDPLTGWISGSYYAVEIGGGTNDNGFITRIENGSVGWYDFIYEDHWKPRAICFTTADSGWGVGQSGLFMDTQDNGGHWTIQYLEPTLLMNDIFFSDNNHGWAVGNAGTVMYTNNNGYTGMEDQSNTGRMDPELEIFPNPAGRNFQIRFEIKSEGEMKICMFNNAGQCVKELFNGHLKEGRQNMELSLPDLPYGIYYVQVIAPEKLMIKRLIIQQE